MPNLQVKNMPEHLHERLRRHARERNRSMSATVIEAIEQELDRHEWRKRLAQRPETDLGTDAAGLLSEERVLRDAERQ
ncbi:FitA-like ribbon-helix-helix domain-containing protein [Candidatus Poriferisodalis sp.]|uniref:FitA-like ribbon-helix-helix domain-containing protein n=1 Tax=Candidatus Poriferisodalis sp. TaxID=3101277 RepID=UPI003B020FB4